MAKEFVMVEEEDEDDISFVSTDEVILLIPQKQVKQIPYLDMLTRQNPSQKRIQTNAKIFDLCLIHLIANIYGYCPDSKVSCLHPVGFRSHAELCDFFGIVDIKYDENGIYTKEIIDNLKSFFPEKLAITDPHIKLMMPK